MPIESMRTAATSAVPKSLKLLPVFASSGEGGRLATVWALVLGYLGTIGTSPALRAPREFVAFAKQEPAGGGSRNIALDA
jgi:hypothetical protein